MAAFGVAAHEVGHAIQHAAGYAPLKFRSAWVPVASLGSGLSTFVIIAAFFMGGLATTGGSVVAYIGLAMFAAVTVFTLITLPVEFDASRRALIALGSDRLDASTVNETLGVLLKYEDDLSKVRGEPARAALLEVEIARRTA